VENFFSKKWLEKKGVRGGCLFLLENEDLDYFPLDSSFLENNGLYKKALYFSGGGSWVP